MSEEQSNTQTNVSRIQAWRWSVTKHPPSSQISKSQELTLKRDFHWIFYWRQSQTNTCLLLESDPKFLGVCSVQLINLFRMRHLGSAQGSSSQSVGWKKCNWLPKNGKAAKQIQLTTRSLCCFTRLLSAAQKISLLPFLMHYAGFLMQIYILVSFYFLVVSQLNLIGQCEMYFKLIGTSVRNKNSNGNCFIFLTAREININSLHCSAQKQWESKERWVLQLSGKHFLKQFGRWSSSWVLRGQHSVFLMKIYVGLSQHLLLSFIQKEVFCAFKANAGGFLE